MDYGHSIDEWAEDTEDDFCDACDDWTDDDGHGNCKACGIKYKSVDPFISPAVATAYSSTAPTVSASGDLYGRTSGYTWGSGGSWWNRGVSAMTSMWGHSSSQSDKKTRMLKNKRHLDSLCKVVDPTVKHTLNYSTDSSYSSINRGLIYVDGSLLEDNDDKLDVVAGLAIHEKLHLVHSKPLLSWERTYGRDKDLLTWQQSLLHNIGNIIEDEYIESQLAKTHGGFTSYIEKVKTHYFEKHGEKMAEGDSEFGNVLNTLLSLVRFPSALDAERKKKHAKHIQFFARALAPAYTDRASSLVAIQAVYEYMVQLAKDLAKSEASDESPKEEAERRAAEKYESIINDWGGEDALTEEVKGKMMDKLIEDIKLDVEYERRHSVRSTVRDGEASMPKELADYAKGMSDIDSYLDKQIKELEDTEYSEEKWDTSKALGLRKGTKVTWRNQRSNEDGNFGYDKDLARMKPAIGQLKRRIQLFGNTNKYTIRNQRRGKLDKKMLHKIPLGRPDLFKNTIIDEDKPLDVCLLVDESGSMGSYKMAKARQTALALREALKDNQALNLWVFGHTADGYDWDGTGETNMSCYWSPTYQNDIKAIGAMRARSENRDGMAILASAERVKAESPSMGSNKLMIVISDGEPSAKDYRYHVGVPHVKKVVSHLEGQGWNIIELGITGARESAMREMFKNYVIIEDTAELSGTVSKIIRRVIKV
jgi:hypothetical protein|tara:strand:- start:195 stop:2312 length:2118 start_codon:yes stop_codon:yes gene_type:complete